MIYFFGRSLTMKSFLSPLQVAKVGSAIVVPFLLGSSLFAETPDKRINNAADSFQEIMKVPEKGIPAIFWRRRSVWSSSRD
jgi:hypothetical protein